MTRVTRSGLRSALALAAITACAVTSGLGARAATPVASITGFTPTNGPVGTIVTIDYTNLVSLSKVEFGGKSVRFFLGLKAYEVDARVPSGMKSGKITLVGHVGTEKESVTVVSAGAFDVVSSS